MKLVVACMLLVLSSAFISSPGYPVFAFYAYQQKVSRGANFSSKEKNKPADNYYVYLEVKKGRTISIADVWINGKKVKFETEEAASPVTIEKTLKLGKNDAEEIIVPATANNLLHIIVKDIDDKTTIPLRYKNYVLLIRYKEGKNVYYLGSKEWQELAPQVNQ